MPSKILIITDAGNCEQGDLIKYPAVSSADSSVTVNPTVDASGATTYDLHVEAAAAGAPATEITTSDASVTLTPSVGAGGQAVYDIAITHPGGGGAPSEVVSGDSSVTVTSSTGGAGQTIYDLHVAAGGGGTYVPPTQAHFGLSFPAVSNTAVHAAVINDMTLSGATGTCPVTISGNVMTVSTAGFLGIDFQVIGVIPNGDVVTEIIYSSVAGFCTRRSGGGALSGEQIAITESKFTIPIGGSISAAGTRGNAGHHRIPVSAGDTFYFEMFVGGIGLNAGSDSWVHVTHELT